MCGRNQKLICLMSSAMNALDMALYKINITIILGQSVVRSSLEECQRHCATSGCRKMLMHTALEGLSIIITELTNYFIWESIPEMDHRVNASSNYTLVEMADLGVLCHSGSGGGGWGGSI